MAGDGHRHVGRGPDHPRLRRGRRVRGDLLPPRFRQALPRVGAPRDATTLTQVKSLAAPYPDVAALVGEFGQPLPPDAFDGSEWSLTDAATAARLRNMRAAGIPLGEYVKGQVYRGVLTGLNKAFVIDGAKREELISQDPNSAEIIEPFATGKDVHKWTMEDKDRWMIFTRRGTDIQRYPAIGNHLAQWKSELTPKKTGREAVGRKPGSYKWFEIQDNVAYYRAFEKPKIVYQVFQVKPGFAYDPAGNMTNNAVWIVPLDDLYLLGVMNSMSFWSEITRHCTAIQNGYQLIYKYLEKCLVPRVTTAEREAIAGLVQNCLDAKGVGCEEWEAEIDGRVAALYGLWSPVVGLYNSPGGRIT